MKLIIWSAFPEKINCKSKFIGQVIHISKQCYIKCGSGFLRLHKTQIKEKIYLNSEILKKIPEHSSIKIN